MLVNLDTCTMHTGILINHYKGTLIKLCTCTMHRGVLINFHAGTLIKTFIQVH